jgi:hypothetical protein
MLPDKKINALWQKLNASTPHTTSWRVIAEVIKPDGSTFPFQDLRDITTIADYAGSVGPQIILTAKMGVVFYKTHILAERDDLKIRVTYKPQSEMGSTDPTLTPIIQTYDAVLIDTIDVDMLGLMDDDRLLEQEVSNLISIRFSLILPILNEMRLVEIGGIFNNTNVEDLIVNQLSYKLGPDEVESVLRAPLYKGVRGVGIFPPSNERTYEHIVVPVGTRLTKLVTYLQGKYGIYGAGVGCYFEQGYWYVFPLYATNRFLETKIRMTVVVLNPRDVPSNDHTFMVEKDHYTVFVSGSVDIKDDTEKTMMNVGSGLRFQRSSDLETGLYSVSKNKAVGLRDKVNRNVATEQRRKGLQHMRYTEDRFTDNPFVEFSRLSEGLGQLVTVDWEMSNPNILYPGMPVKMLYRKNKQTQFVYGTVVGYRSKASSSGNLADNDYRIRTKLVLFVEKTPSLIE